MWTTNYYGFWDYWELRHKVTFDGPNKIIIVNDDVTSIDVQRDIYSAWKEWVQYEENSKYLQAITAVGGEPTIENQKLDVTFFLINGWKIKPYSGNYTLNIIGNLFDVDGGEIKIPADVIEGISNNITINTNTSVIVRQVEPDVYFTTDDRSTLNYISGSVVAIESILSQPVTASLVDSQYQLLLDIQTKLNSVHTEVTGITETVGSIDTVLSSVSNVVDVIDINISGITTNITTLQSSVDNVSGSIFDLTNNVNIISSSIGTIDNDIQQLISNDITVSSSLDLITTYTNEVHTIHGLKLNNPVTVTYTNRSDNNGTIDQSFNISGGTGITRTTTITRN